MSAKTMEELKDRICEELDELSEKVAREGKMSMSDIEKAGELVEIKKNMLKAEMLEDGGYSHGGDWEARGRFGNSYNDGGNSYRGRNRDSIGRYSRDADRSYVSHRRGYSRGSDLMEHVDMMMEEASNDNERDAIRHFKKQLESM